MASKDQAPLTGVSLPQAADALVLAPEQLDGWDRASSLEWLVGNGIGGYASGTMAGANTRRYHGFLVAAVDPPAGRVVLVAHVEETVSINGETYPLASSQWWDGSVSPRGYEQLEGFHLEHGIPVFSYRCGPHHLEKRVWMDYGENVARAAYTWPDGAPPAAVSIKLCLACRDYHGSQHGSSSWHWRSTSLPDGIAVSPGDGLAGMKVRCDSFQGFTTENEWYWGFLHAVERERGLDDVEDLWVPGSLQASLTPGQTLFVTASIDDSAPAPAAGAVSLDRERKRRTAVLECARASGRTGDAAADPNQADAPSSVVSTLHCAADAFLVSRPLPGSDTPAHPNSVIAGYHWFCDWGRDTMIALPGLTIVTGRLAAARGILVSWAAYVSEGMLPNRFPDAGGGAPEYNTVDATLWYFQAIHRYLEESQDETLLGELYPVLRDIVGWHRRGTRHGIQVDPTDGLLRAGVPGVQLTWMDARVGDTVVTPRTGKPVEIQALWYNVLRLMESWAPGCNDDPASYRADADRLQGVFPDRFWKADGGYLLDVADGPEGDDTSFRPNQLFALSLPHPLITGDRAESVIAGCEAKLLTPCGLRTLDPSDSHYAGICTGDAGRRDGAYHQGTVWPWLIGAYVDAVLNTQGDVNRASAALQPLLEQVTTAGVGFISEIFDGDAPHHPRGCIAQAWSVAEALRSLSRIKAARESQDGRPRARRGRRK